ncbi:hypothetical protein M413DRAFT_257057 [Hebeloma cylindrosporum]|uniref:Nephrocystin 3-like N-terminal domain-containing protein n=1 Tax=Hebeloma cylindrosporum TaxID=76867 RepID=A0A0C3BLE5_HEBCY|nr:hypothetical protein M413DRAFT_257057 [Hebeloma cylindrosporum h7]
MTCRAFPPVTVTLEKTTFLQGSALPQIHTMSMFSSHTLITGGIITQTHGNVVHVYGAPEGSLGALQRATATAAFHNSEQCFDTPKCHPDTRVVILDKIMRWVRMEENENSLVMWIYGPAGSGKSAIAHTIAELCEDTQLLAAFFFSRSDPSRNSIRPLVATIAYQIYSHFPDLKKSILGALERDPLMFSKSLAHQARCLITEPLLVLRQDGYFNRSTAKRLIIIDGLDECADPMAQRDILEVFSKALHRHHLPLIFLVSSRPEQHISLAFNAGLLWDLSTRVALDESYVPDNDIRLFLTDKFEEIKSTHRLRAYISPQWPASEILSELIKRSSGQFIYASTVIRYVSSIRHKPQDRLDVVLGTRCPQIERQIAICGPRRPVQGYPIARGGN